MRRSLPPVAFPGSCSPAPSSSGFCAPMTPQMVSSELSLRRIGARGGAGVLGRRRDRRRRYRRAYRQSQRRLRDDLPPPTTCDRPLRARYRRLRYRSADHRQEAAPRRRSARSRAATASHHLEGPGDRRPPSRAAPLTPPWSVRRCESRIRSAAKKPSFRSRPAAGPLGAPRLAPAATSTVITAGPTALAPAPRSEKEKST